VTCPAATFPRLHTGQPLRGVFQQGKEFDMGVFDKAKDKAEQFMGEAKEKLGQHTDNEDMENAGKRDQASGEAKEQGHDLRDKAMGAMKDAKDKFSNN